MFFDDALMDEMDNDDGRMRATARENSAARADARETAQSKGHINDLERARRPRSNRKVLCPGGSRSVEKYPGRTHRHASRIATERTQDTYSP